MLRILFICTGLLITIGSQAQQWVKVWSDDFNTSGLPDTSKWSYDIGPFMNGEAQYYTYRRIENSYIDNNSLVIEARKEDYLGASYTSARMVSRFNGDWTYGRIETRAKIPTGKGSFPAIWMMPTESIYGGWPSSGEIDIMENVGFDPDNLYATVHFYGTDGTGHQQNGNHVTITAPYDAFHIYAIEWTPDKIDWFIDDTKVHTYNRPNGSDYRLWPFNERFYLILNLAIGGQWGGAQGIDPAIFPLKFVIDYVRIYQWQTQPGPYSLTLEPVTGGTVEAYPQLENYTAGTSVELTATPAQGYYFGGFLYMGYANPLTIQMVDDHTVIPLFYKAGELIKNGTFDRGLSGWNNIYINNYATQSAKTSWQDGIYVFQIIKPATEWWHMGDQWQGIPAVRGKTYQVFFDAWADVPGQIGISFARNSGNYAAYYENPSLAISQAKTRYTWQFTFNSPSDNNCRLFFGMGRFTGKVYLDNISMTQLLPTTMENLEKSDLPEVIVGTEPSTGRISVSLTLSQPEKVLLAVCNLHGAEITTIYYGPLSEGFHQFQDGLNKIHISPGVYLLKYKDSRTTSYTKFALY